MGCNPIGPDNNPDLFNAGVRGIVCTRDKPKKCHACGENGADRLCDGPPRGRGKTCDRSFHRRCGVDMGDGKDLCRDCYRARPKQSLEAKPALMPLVLTVETERQRVLSTHPAYADVPRPPPRPTTTVSYASDWGSAMPAPRLTHERCPKCGKTKPIGCEVHAPHFTDSSRRLRR